MILSELGNKVKDLRKEKKLTQEKLAKMVGISRNTLSKLENGYLSNISIVTLNKVLNELDYELELKEVNPFANSVLIKD
ncbi:MAG: helix-turn-helix domain-containing protein [Sulfurimonas sp.]|nr:helix-turn-helix domain-containing protein [Sulfurimonas sp.]